jgi:hypothetical protein
MGVRLESAQLTLGSFKIRFLHMNKINTIQIVQLPQSAFFWILNLICENDFPNKKKCELYFINI